MLAQSTHRECTVCVERVCTKQAACAQSRHKSEPAGLAHGACSECAKSACAVLAQGVCSACGESEHKAAEHAWSVHTHTGSTHVCARARCPPAVAQPPCVEQDMHWHTSSPEGTTCIRRSQQGRPSCPPAPQLQCPLNVGCKPWPKHCPFAMVGFSVKIPRFWGTRRCLSPSLHGK